jgi:hypothetical protein
MGYNTQNHWVIGIFPLSRILNTRKHNVSETDSVSVLSLGEGDLYSVGSLRESRTLDLSVRLDLSKGSNRVGYLSPLTCGRKQIRFPKRCVF